LFEEISTHVHMFFHGLDHVKKMTWSGMHH